MSGDWNTKYGTRRVRHDPPTLEEAIFAAIGITDDVEAQAEIASSLMGLPYDEVLAEVKKTARVSARTGTATRVTACWKPRFIRPSNASSKSSASR